MTTLKKWLKFSRASIARVRASRKRPSLDPHALGANRCQRLKQSVRRHVEALLLKLVYERHKLLADPPWGSRSDDPEIDVRFLDARTLAIEARENFNDFFKVVIDVNCHYL